MTLQQQVQDAIDEMVAAGGEVSMQVKVVHEGRVVVDAVAGVADPRTGQPVTCGTLFFATSTGKGAATTVAHVLVERGGVGLRASGWPTCGASSEPTARAP